MKSIFYLDTSGLNYLADNVKNFELFKGIKKHLNFDLYLSPITLWEVLLNSKVERKEYLIYWAQFNCANSLVKSPTEIIIDYIRSDCPIKDRRAFLNNPYTKMDIGKVWQNIHSKIEQTMLIDIGALKEKTQPIRKLSKYLKTIINRMCNESQENYEKDPFHKAMKQALINLKRSHSPDIETERIYKISLVFLFFILCIGVELQNDILREYWKTLNIEDPFDRLDYLIKNYPILIVQGPLAEMAKMADIQLFMENANSRGLLHDCFHTVYCYYADNFISGDAHFGSLKDQLRHPVFDKIIMTEQIQEIWRLVIEKRITGSS